MNKTIEYLLIFSVGIATGVLSTRGYFEKKYRLRADEEIESVKRVYNGELKLYFKDKNPENAPDPEPEKPVMYESTIVNNGYSERTIEESTDYRKFYDQSSKEAAYEDKLEEEMAKKEAPSEETKPYLISDVDYSETMDQYDKLCCTFYVPDRIVVDDISREVIEPDVLGEDNIEYMIKSTQDFIYIRNESIGCDMEISKNYESVAETGDVVW